MYLNSEQIEAFFQVAKLLSFSKAADTLGLSQPALSIRIRKLEESMKTSLFLRETSGIRLTEVGHKLFLHCQIRGDLEQELLSEIRAGRQSQSTISGLVRVAGFSTVVKSVLIPTLTEITQKYPEIQIETLTLELHELKNSLKRSEAEFVLTEGPLVAGNIESVLVGCEQNVVVEAKNILPEKAKIYLDNDPDDQATFNFFKAQKGKMPKFQRWFLDDAHSILEACEQGWGRAIHPKHIVQHNKKLRIVEGFETINAEVFLNYFKQPFYSKLHLLVQNQIISEFAKRLPKSN